MANTREQAFYEFSYEFSYRETPHSTTGVAPNHLMFGYMEAMANDARAKKKRMKEEYDARMKANLAAAQLGYAPPFEDALTPQGQVATPKPAASRFKIVAEPSK